MHAYLIVGDTSSTQHVVRTLLAKHCVPDDASALFRLIPSTSSSPASRRSGVASIRIGDVRALKRWNASRGATPRACLITDAPSLTILAQQTLLKTLEEPGENMVFILLTTDESVLLPTLRSRCRLIRVRPPQRPDAHLHATRQLAEFIRRTIAVPQYARIAKLYHGSPETTRGAWRPGTLSREDVVRLLTDVIETTKAATPTHAGTVLRLGVQALRKVNASCHPALTLQQFILDIPFPP